MAAHIQKQLGSMLPAPLALAPIESLKEVIKSSDALAKLAEMNPEMAIAFEEYFSHEPAKDSAMRQLDNFANIRHDFIFARSAWLTMTNMLRQPACTI